MRQPLSLIAAVAIVASTAAGVQAQSAPPAADGAAGRAARVSRTDADFMKMATQSGVAEVRAAYLALSRAGDPAVRDFARRMIEDHLDANARLRQLARSRNLPLPTEPSVLHKSKLRLLEASEGPDFDRRYVDDFGVEAHRSAIWLFRSQLDRGGAADVRAFARRLLPRLEQHLRHAQDTQARIHSDRQYTGRLTGSGAMGAARTSSSEADEVRQELFDAVQVVQRMKSDPGVTALLRQAKGVFIMPAYGRAAFGLGVQGGEGIFVTRNGDRFGNPVFYDMGGLSIGAQAGVAGGEIALLLMTDRAVRDFRSGKKFSLNADAGLTISDYSQRRHASAGKLQDVVVWSGTRGAYAGVSIGLNDVIYDAEANRAYYGREGLSPERIIDGAVPPPDSNVLGIVLTV